jgi:hypothetical protein
VEFDEAPPFDCRWGLDDTSSAFDPANGRHLVQETNFFRGLALIDLAEAMLRRAPGTSAVTVGASATGRGDFTEIDVDPQVENPLERDEIIRSASCRRLGRVSVQDLHQPHPGRRAIEATRRSDRADSSVSGSDLGIPSALSRVCARMSLPGVR